MCSIWKSFHTGVVQLAVLAAKEMVSRSTIGPAPSVPGPFTHREQDAARATPSVIPPDAVRAAISVAKETLAARPIRLAAPVEGAVIQGAGSKPPTPLDRF